MSGDYTRFTFDPARGYSGVRQQQGRVSLDADFNEFEDILDRRQRATTLDLVGQAVVPDTTPDGFAISASAAGELTIGPGRAYVDGILVECFGDPDTAVRDDVLGGMKGTDAVSYEKQPFHYEDVTTDGGVTAYPSLSGKNGDINLVYLDVWQREVTVFEEPRLREPALGGPDTTTRVQTAWQVKVLPNVNAASCSDEIPAWNTVIAPSTARLTVSTAPVPSEVGPCIVDPAVGYTGTENRLYRVEVQRSGTLGGAGNARARFTWSRDNASIAAAVKVMTEEAGKAVLTVEQPGPDQWRSIARDQWIELLDDDIELARRESGHGGHIVKVFDVRPATGQIVIEAAQAAVPIDLDRHPRIVRWDTAEGQPAAVRDVAKGTAIPLEEGIQVTFDGSDGDTLHAGDYWVFPARTVENQPGPLVNAPPRGILHHYARLALVTTGVAGLLDDCRVPWPPPSGEGCCSAVVFPGDSIQDAIDLLDDTGGCVCLKAGEHEIREPLAIRRGDLTLKGEAPWVTVRLVTDGTHMLAVDLPDGGENVSVTGILFEAPGAGDEASMVRVRNLTRGAIRECGFRVGGGDPYTGSRSTAIALDDCAKLAIADNAFAGFATGIVGKDSAGIRVRDNTLQGPVMSEREDPVSIGTIGIAFAADGAGLLGIRIEGNDLAHYRRGIQIGDPRRGVLAPAGPRDDGDDAVEAGCRIAGNVVRRIGDTRQVGEFDGDAAAIAAFVSRCEILENAMAIACPTDVGVLTAGRNTLIARNEVRSTAPFNVDDGAARLPYGVLFAPTAGGLGGAIRENLFSGLQQAIIVGRGPAVEGRFRDRAWVDVVANRIVGDAKLLEWAGRDLASGPEEFEAKVVDTMRAYAAILVARRGAARVAENEIVGAVGGILVLDGQGSLVANRIANGAVGAMLASRDASAAIAEAMDNIVSEMSVAGIVTLRTDGAIVARNTIANAGLGVFALLSDATRIHDNRVAGGTVGIDLYLERDPVVHGNTVEDATLAGIRTLTCVHEVTLSDNHVTRCGYRGEDEMPGVPAYGIHAIETFGTVSVTGCHVVDTGEPSAVDWPLFTGARLGIAVEHAGGVRAHANVVVSRPLALRQVDKPMPHPDSRALLVITFPNRVIDRPPETDVEISPADWPFADASDNHLEQDVGMLAELRAGQVEKIDDETITGNGEVIFAANRCLNTAPELENDGQATVDITAAHVTVTGNQIRNVPRWMALRVRAGSLSAVGNSISGGSAISAGTETPAPFDAFNVVL